MCAMCSDDFRLLICFFAAFMGEQVSKKKCFLDLVDLWQLTEVLRDTSSPIPTSQMTSDLIGNIRGYVYAELSTLFFDAVLGMTLNCIHIFIVWDRVIQFQPSSMLVSADLKCSYIQSGSWWGGHVYSTDLHCLRLTLSIPTIFRHGGSKQELVFHDGTLLPPYWKMLGID